MILPVDAPIACADDAYTFETLIDPTYTSRRSHVIDRAAKLCLSCPVRRECWDEQAGEEWLALVRQHIAAKAAA